MQYAEPGGEPAKPYLYDIRKKQKLLQRELVDTA